MKCQDTAGTQWIRVSTLSRWAGPEQIRRDLKDRGCEKQPDPQIHVKLKRPWEACSAGLLPHGTVERSIR